MALADSRGAIGAVSTLLKDRLAASTSAVSAEVGRPDAAILTGGDRFNLFLYEIGIDPHLRNQPLDRGQSPPLWLILKYLLTAFDNGKESDTTDAHSLLGEGMLALQELNFIDPPSVALADNPDLLKITFDNADSELLSKVMQGSDEKYRVSIAFQVRPVMIAPSVPPSYSLPVATVGPPGNEGVVVMPDLGPRLESVVPQKFVSDTELTITGQGVNAAISEVIIGDQSFAVSSVAEGQVKTIVPESTSLSAGSHPLYLQRQLPAGKKLKSDALVVQLLPEVSNATPGAPTPLTTTNLIVHGDLTIDGKQMGGVDDSIFVALYKDGNVVLMLEAPGSNAQAQLVVTVTKDHKLTAGNYYVIVRVNGAQSIVSPEVDWS
ncbi:MAG: DUF4255 domain-containing protein [Planctomycetaceae bacterium]|nr:DUF4255 domain-containing protein [Planctomycetaceae bacterium]